MEDTVDLIKKFGDELINDNPDEDLVEIEIGCSNALHNNKKWKGPENLY